MAVAAVAGAALIGGLLGQGLWQEPARPAAIDVSQLSPALPVPTASAASPEIAGAAGVGVTAAQNSLSGLERPGYKLTDSAAAALAEVRATVSDAVALQQLRAQILAPAPGSGLTAAALSDLVSLVRQAQISSSLAMSATVPVPALNSTALTQAEADVRTAQAALLQATKSRDEAALSGSASATGRPIAPPSLSTLPPASAAATPMTPPQAQASAATPAVASAQKSADSAALQDAQAQLGIAQKQLQTALSVPSPDQVNAAEQAIDQALAAIPPAPSEDMISAAMATVDRTQKDFDAANQPPVSSVAVAARNAAAAPRSTVVSRGPATSDSASLSIGSQPDSQRVADTKANLDSAKAALAKLQRQAAVAADPEAQPAVKAAREHAATVRMMTPDPATVANARAAVASIQQEIATLHAKASAGASTTAAAATATAGTGSLTNPTPPAPGVAGAVAAASSSVAGAQPLDPVALAEQQLAVAQKRVHDLVFPPGSDSAGSSAQIGTNGTATALATAAPSAEVLAAQASLATAGQVSPHDITAIEVALRATFVTDAVLKVESLHPSALSLGATVSLTKPAPGRPNGTLAWPVNGPITQAFGVPELGVGAPHTGVDIGVSVGTPVLAAAPGIVSFAGGDPAIGYGYYTIIDHGAGVSTLYGHLALPPLVHQGQFLAPGGLIGLSGSTGFSTGPHVHFEVRLNGTPVDPLRVLVARH